MFEFRTKIWITGEKIYPKRAISLTAKLVILKHSLCDVSISPTTIAQLRHAVIHVRVHSVESIDEEDSDLAGRDFLLDPPTEDLH
jgi:hypothetical protein